MGCDLLKNIYLCGINNNKYPGDSSSVIVVICLKISTFVEQQLVIAYMEFLSSCDLLENIYLCGINNNISRYTAICIHVVICLKISTFVVSTTTPVIATADGTGCDLLENIYLCGINNNYLGKI